MRGPQTAPGDSVGRRPAEPPDAARRPCYNENRSAQAIQNTFMFLSVKEMELRKVRFDETFPP